MDNLKKLFSRGIIGIIFLTVVPIISHLLFSPLGFNPTDDGFFLAYSRRLLNGEIPYKDFVMVAPFGTPVLHAAEVYSGGNYTFIISRFIVWVEFAVIAWVWVLILKKMTGIKQNRVEMFLLGLIVFIFNVHSFPIMAWYTIDGLLLATLGLRLTLGEKTQIKSSGYFLTGLAVLCKQNFVILIPVFLILNGDWKKIAYWLSGFTPLLLFTIYLVRFNALENAFFQMSTLNNFSTFKKYGIESYLNAKFLPFGLLGGYFIGKINGKIQERRSGKNYRVVLITISCLILLAVPSVSAYYLGQNFYTYDLAFGIFGFTLGLLLSAVYQIDGNLEKAGLIILITAWVVSLSDGYNTPALTSGLFICYLFIFQKHQIGRSVYSTYKISNLLTAIIFTITIISVFGFYQARTNYIYREKNASFLTYPLDNIFPGAYHIRTNENVYKFLVDLNRAISLTDKHTYTIVPELAAYWVDAPQKNPLPNDRNYICTGSCNLGNSRLLPIVSGSLIKQRGTLTVIVQKVGVQSLADGFFALEIEPYYSIVNIIKEKYTKAGETRYFELYK